MLTSSLRILCSPGLPAQGTVLPTIRWIFPPQSTRSFLTGMAEAIPNPVKVQQDPRCSKSLDKNKYIPDGTEYRLIPELKTNPALSALSLTCTSSTMIEWLFFPCQFGMSSRRTEFSLVMESISVSFH